VTRRDKRPIESGAKKPSRCKPDLDAIPADLRAVDHWVLWEWKKRKGKWTKVPYSPKTSEEAKANDPATWDSFDNALATARRYHKQFDGIGFEFSPDDPFTGIDLDDAIDPDTGELKPWARHLVERFSSYTEFSPTRTGVKIVVRGRKPGDKCKKKYEDGEIEIYDQGRYFTITGQRLPGTPATIEDRQAELDTTYAELFCTAGQGAPRADNSNGKHHHQPLSDDEVIRRAGEAPNGDKFRALMAGDTSRHSGDDSAADMALVWILAFWCDKDAAQMDRIFRQSSLMRDKWDEQRGESTYGEGTIAEAIAFVKDTYRPGVNGRKHPDGKATAEKNAAVVARLQDQAKADPSGAIDAALQPEPLTALARLCHEAPGELEALYRSLQKGGAKAKDVQGFRQAITREYRRLKRERAFDPPPKAPPANAPAAGLKMFTNYFEEEAPCADGTTTVKVGYPIQHLATELTGLTEGWPCRVDNVLFAEGAGPAPLWPERPPQLFAWVNGQLTGTKGNPLRWGEGEDMVSEARFHAYLTQNVHRFDGVEAFPHEPLLPTHCYIHPPVEGGNGQALAGLLQRFCPAGDIDQDLVKGFFLSLGWGGRPGTRPGWLFTAEDDDGEGGRGAGKTRMAMMGAYLFGGFVGVDKDDKMPDIFKRLLSPSAMAYRVLLLDNIKTLKFSWSQLEALITSDVISGHRMYHGEGRRPNTLTVCITLNGAGLSKDLAQRNVIVKVTRPTYSGNWEEETKAYIDANRWAIIGDILAELRRPCKPLARHSRWGAWEDAVLARLSEPDDVQQVIAERQAAVDEDQTEAEMVRDHFVQRLRGRGHDPDRVAVFIPSAVAAVWVNDATGERRATNRACAYLNQLSIKELRKSMNSEKSRGFAWRGKDGKPDNSLGQLNPPPQTDPFD
jgi:hypothetical protein